MEKLTHQASKVAVGTAVSRVLGYARDMLVAHAFGAGFAADAFYAAFRIPNLLRRVLGEGSFSASFIPVFSEYYHTKSKEETQEFLNATFTVLTFVLTVLTLLGMLFSPEIVKLIAWGFKSDPAKLDLTIQLTRIMFPYLLFVCLAALALGILNTLESFFLPAVAPAMLSIAEIAFIIGIAPLLSPDDKIIGLSYSVTVAGLMHFLVQWPRIKTLGWKIRFKLDFNHPGLKKVSALMLPAMIGISVDQINTFVNTICASFLVQGSITALYYSNRLVQMPLAIFGLALASVSLPAMAKSIATNDLESMKNALNYSLKFILFILIPSAVGLMVIGLPITRVLFERGNFNLEGSMLTYSGLFYYSLGLPAYAGSKVLANGFYSFQNTKTPVKIAAVAMVINIILSVWLMHPMGVGGLALAASISSWFNVIILAYYLQKKIKVIDISQLFLTSVKAGIAGLIMAVVCYYLAFVAFMNHMYIGMFVSLLSGIAAYFILAWILGIEESKHFYKLLRKIIKI
ncbi:MAG: murein biosynthesis integral membrane protein MurJ [Elusimicrobia bacterium]|nr:murein biosynthesis integral membrane protein MurJ [Candidatus Liberimonas magnetica]